MPTEMSIEVAHLKFRPKYAFQGEFVAQAVLRLMRQDVYSWKKRS